MGVGNIVAPLDSELWISASLHLRDNNNHREEGRGRPLVNTS